MLISSTPAFKKMAVDLVSKFKGSLVGALLGDCLGSPYEYLNDVPKDELQEFLDNLEDPKSRPKKLLYTDDTAMTRSIAKSLIAHKGFNEVDVAKRFVYEYNNDPHDRGYGCHVPAVFQKLQKEAFQDIYRPASEQFNGTGSYGNGAPMRTAPVALFYYDNLPDMLAVAKKVSQITHSHELAINGAILECLAIRKCLLLDPKKELDVHTYVTELIQEMSSIESGDIIEESYRRKLGYIRELLDKKTHPEDEEVVSKLGNDIRALYSVPIAIFGFLKAQKEIPFMKTNNPFRRTIQYTISLNGDTDTTATMAGAIAGAYYGLEGINPALQKHCESINDATKFGEDLFKARNEH